MARLEEESVPNCNQEDLDIPLQGNSVSLQGLLGFSEDFLKSLTKVKVISFSYATKLLDSHSVEKSKFIAGRLCCTEEE